jgi:hypothetical protein
MTTIDHPGRHAGHERRDPDHGPAHGTGHHARDTSWSVQARAAGLGGGHGGPVPRGRDAHYELVHHDVPAGGWSLHARAADGRCWSTALGCHGAPHAASRADAEFVATRVLRSHGVLTGPWEEVALH